MLQAPQAEGPTARRRLGVHAEHDSYKWWALSCTSLGMLLATINSGTLIIALPDLERSLHTSLLELVWVILVYMIASTVLVLSAGRLSDQFGRKKAYVMGFVVFAVASLGAGFAAQRHPADPVADPSGDRRRLPVRQRGGDRHRRLPQGAARAWPWAPTRWWPPWAWSSARSWAARWWRSPGIGCSGSTCPSASRAACGAGYVLHEVTGRSEDRSFDYLGTITFLIGLTGLVYGISKGGLVGLDLAADDPQPHPRRGVPAGCSC